jgi:hypothetical protein
MADIVDKLLSYLSPAVRRLTRERDGLRALIGDRTWWIHHRHHALCASPAISSGSTVFNRTVVERLLRAYRSSHSGQYGKDSMWVGFFNNYQIEMHKIFMGDDVEKAFRVLSNPQENNLFYGFDELCSIFAKQRHDSISAIALREQDNLIRLAEAIGAICLENPETPKSWHRYKDTSTDEIVGLIEAKLGKEICFPDLYPGAAGLKSCRGLIGYRALQSLYFAIQLHRFSRDLPQLNRPVKICEIGAGLGRSAYYASQFGLRDYTLVDIPMTAISQGYYLIQLLGETVVVLPGEKRTSDLQVRIMHPDEFFASDEKYDVVANMDSLTELGRELATQYIEKISRSARCLVSINHESNPIRVFDLIEEAGRPYKVQRFPCWMRRGYVEEYVQFDYAGTKG